MTFRALNVHRSAAVAPRRGGQKPWLISRRAIALRTRRLSLSETQPGSTTGIDAGDSREWLDALAKSTRLTYWRRGPDARVDGVEMPLDARGGEAVRRVDPGTHTTRDVSFRPIDARDPSSVFDHEG